MHHKRRRQLVQYLAETGSAVGLKELTALFHVGDRTIRYDLKEISEWLRAKGFTLTHYAGKAEWQLCLNQNEGQRLLSLLRATSQEESPHTSSMERQLLLAHYLLLESGWITLSEMADELAISKGTVLQDLEKVEKWLAPFSIRVISSNKGYTLRGVEKDRRQAILSSITWFESFWEEIHPIHQLNWTHLTHQDLDQLELMIVSHLGEYVELDDFAIHHLHNVLAIQLHRIRQNGNIDSSEIELTDPSLDALPIVDRIQQLSISFRKTFGVTIDPMEQQYFLHQLMAVCSDAVAHTFHHYFSEPTFHFFKNAIFPRLGITKPEDQLDQAMKMEWEKVWWQLTFDLKTTSPILDKFKEKYGFIHHQLMEALKDAVPTMHAKVSDHHLIRLAMLLASQFESEFPLANKHKAMIVCPNGYATSQLLATQLKKQFPEVEVIGIYSLKSFKKMNHSIRPDFILSTTPITLLLV